jgi:hypothetical protein
MANGLSRIELHRLARVGAQTRLEELKREQAELLRAFPGLSSGRRIARRSSSASPTTSNGAQPRRRTHNMSAAERKAVSLRMKKYWAGRRKEKTAGEK